MRVWPERSVRVPQLLVGLLRTQSSAPGPGAYLLSGKSCACRNCESHQHVCAGVMHVLRALSIDRDHSPYARAAIYIRERMLAAQVSLHPPWLPVRVTAGSAPTPKQDQLLWRLPGSPDGRTQYRRRDPEKK